MLWRCWLGSRKGIRPVKNWSGGVLAWLSVRAGRGADLHMAQLMPLPLTVSCCSKIQIGFTFLVPADPGSPRQRLLNGCVYVCVWLSCNRKLAGSCFCGVQLLMLSSDLFTEDLCSVVLRAVCRVNDNSDNCSSEFYVCLTRIADKVWTERLVWHWS